MLFAVDTASSQPGGVHASRPSTMLIQAELFEGFGAAMRNGLLSGGFTRERAGSLPEDDWRSGHPDFTEPGLSANLAVVERLQAIAGDLGCTVVRGRYPEAMWLGKRQ